MPLATSTRLGPYEILAPIGAGGMGEVYKARDTRLDRIVAIKVAQQDFSERFEREARAVAALNHPHICALYDVGPNYLVMELVEGAPLTGPLPLDKAIDYAGQILDALDQAHRKGITHRDLKPANILVTKQGVKLLDFGLAKLTPAPLKETDETLTKPLTRDGQILGTLQYMSPEQLQGKETDPRSDLFAFGCVLYEMLTGKRPFDGSSAASVIAAIIERPAPSIHDVAPPALDRVLKRCLEKDPEKRWQNALDLKSALEMARAFESATTSPSRARFRYAGWIMAGALAIVAALGWIRASHPAAITTNDIALSIVPPRGETLLPVGSFFVERISPDGSMVLFRTGSGFGASKFYVRRLNSLESEPFPDLAWFGGSFWSPDSQSITFQADNNRLMKMRVPKGSPELITKDMVGAERGASWGENGLILFAQTDKSGASLYTVPASGGTPVRVDFPGFEDGSYLNPEFLPGATDFLFEFIAARSVEGQVFLATLRDGKAVNPHMLLNNETAAAFTPAGGGRILFVRNNNLYSQRVDLNARKLSGEPELLQERVVSNAMMRSAIFSVSRTGTIVWRSGTEVLSEITVFDRRGNRVGIAGTPAPVSAVRLAPDESHLLAMGTTAGSWIVDANGPGKVALNWRRGLALWSIDSSKLISVDGTKLVERSVGSGQSHELAELPAFYSRILHGMSADGRKVLFGGVEQGAFLLDLDRKGPPQRVLEQRADNAALSPDGTWIVYRPNSESGVYVKPILGSGLPRQIASNGSFPVWRGDGKEILYVDRDQNKIWSVGVEGSGEKLQFLPSQPLFAATTPMGLGSGSIPLAVNRDGSRIYFLQSAEQPDSGVINVRTGAVR